MSEADEPLHSTDALEGAIFVTGNRNKLREARRLCGCDLHAKHVDLPEIQSLAIEEVLHYKAQAARAVVESRFVVEETGLELEAMNRFPGPLVKWMLESMGATGIASIAQGLDNPRATARCRLHYQDGDVVFTGEGSTTGTLVLPPRGAHGFGWDPVFVPDGETRTYAELAPEEKDRLSHRGRAWRALIARLSAAGL